MGSSCFTVDIDSTGLKSRLTGGTERTTSRTHLAPAVVHTMPRAPREPRPRLGQAGMPLPSRRGLRSETRGACARDRLARRTFCLVSSVTSGMRMCSMSTSKESRAPCERCREPEWPVRTRSFARTFCHPCDCTCDMCIRPRRLAPWTVSQVKRRKEGLPTTEATASLA